MPPLLLPALPMLLLLMLMHLRPAHVVSICGATAVVAVDARLTTRPDTRRLCIKHDDTRAKTTAAMIALASSLLGPTGIGTVESTAGPLALRPRMIDGKT